MPECEHSRWPVLVATLAALACGEEPATRAALTQGSQGGMAPVAVLAVAPEGRAGADLQPDALAADGSRAPGEAIAGTSSVQASPSCGTPATTIASIQGEGGTSPLRGETVTVEGVVTASFQGAQRLGGFFLQDPVGDGNPATSEGIFVYEGAVPLAEVGPGQVLRVEGLVAEFEGLTELTEVRNILFCGRVPPLAPTALGAPSSQESLERLESMLVATSEVLTLTDTWRLASYGELEMVFGGRAFVVTRPPDQGGASGDGTAPGGGLRLLLDDGSLVMNPSPPPYLSAGTPLRLGDTAPQVIGILHYAFGAYRLQPTEAPRFTRNNPRPHAPAAVGGDLRLASLNTHNYFVSLGDRGAATLEELDGQRSKLVAALVGLDADIVALQELEARGDEAAEDLASAVNVALGQERYTAVRAPALRRGSPDAIQVGLLYDSDRLVLVGEAMTDTDPIHNRVPLAQGFECEGVRLGVLVVHLKSKSCSNADGLNRDQGNGEGCYAALRRDQAMRLTSYVWEVADRLATEALVVLGDFNAYGGEAPLIELEQGGLQNLPERLIDEQDRYSYAYSGEVGLLDHAFATPDVRVTGATAWHINADEPSLLGYSESISREYFQPDAYRSSDHDPLLVGIEIALRGSSAR